MSKYGSPKWAVSLWLPVTSKRVASQTARGRERESSLDCSTNNSFRFRFAEWATRARNNCRWTEGKAHLLALKTWAILGFSLAPAPGPPPLEAPDGKYVLHHEPPQGWLMGSITPKRHLVHKGLPVSTEVSQAKQLNGSSFDPQNGATHKFPVFFAHPTGPERAETQTTAQAPKTARLQVLRAQARQRVPGDLGLETNGSAYNSYISPA